MTPRYESDHKKKILAAVILLLVLLAAAALSCQVKTVTVTGTKWYTAQQIESMVMEGRWGHSTVLGSVKNRFGAHRSIPFVEDYKVVYRTPFEAEIIVYEKSIVGYVVYMSSNMYFDKDGIIVESTNEKLENVPMITGLDFGQIVLYQPLPVADPAVFEEILNLTQILSTYEIEVDKIHYNADREAELYIGNLVAQLGGNSDMNGKISELSDILRDYPDLNGTLFLDTYDENNTNPMYRFQQNPET